MKLNRLERLAVNNPVRMLQQQAELMWFFHHSTLKQDPVILEIGCGRGAGAKLLYNHFSPKYIAAGDFDISMLQKARRFLSDKEHERILLHAADSCYLPFKNESFDAIFSFGILHHIPAWQNAVQEISRVLKPNGIYFFEDFYPPIYQNPIVVLMFDHPKTNRFYRNDLKSVLNQSNLVLTDSMEISVIGILGIAKKKLS